MSQKQKHGWNPNVYERNAERYYESEDSDDEERVKRKEARNKIEELREKLSLNWSQVAFQVHRVQVQVQVQGMIFILILV
jgi:hypothetical protein